MAWFSVFISYSQNQTTTGIKISANRSDYVFKNIENIRCTMKNGLSFGGFINFPITDYFSFQTELLMSYKGSEIDNKQSGRKGDYQYFSIEIPVYWIAKKKLKQGELFAGAGLYLGAGFKAGMQDFDLYEEEVIKPVDFGTTALIGYEMSNRMQFFLGGQRGFVNLLDVSGNGKMKSRLFLVGIAYKFRPPPKEQIRFNF
jgi:hypothetical protein